MDLKPVVAPPVVAKGGNTTIVLLFLCVISIMASSFYFMKHTQNTQDIKNDFEKKQIQLEARAKGKEVQLKALETRAKVREAQLKALEYKVKSKLADAAKTVKAANELNAKLVSERNEAAKRLREAEAAKKKADASGKANDKKLADEKAKLTADANIKVAAANKKADDAIALARAEATKALNLKANLDKVSAMLSETRKATPTSTLNNLKTDVKLVTPVIIKAAPPPPPPTLGSIRDRIKF